MRSITTIIPTIIIFSFLLLASLVAAPAPASADVIDDLLLRVQTVMEEVAKIQVELQTLKAGQASVSTPTPTPSTPSGSVLGATTFKFTHDVVFGEDNDDVFRIQQLLKTDPEIYPEGTVSGYFGPKTEGAIRNLQTRFGLDPVGVVGPATTALLERLIAQRSEDGTYPADILDPTRPTGSVAGAATSNSGSSNVPSNLQALLDQIEALQNQQTSQSSSNDDKKTSSPSSSNNDGVDSITVEIDDGESLVKVFYDNGDVDNFWVATDEKDEIIDEIADETDLSTSLIEDLVDFGKYKSSNGNADDIDEIQIDVDVEDGVADITVVFEDEDEDDEEFEVEDADLEDIIEEIADELDIDEDDVRDLMEVDYNVRANDIDEIKAVIDGDETEVTVELESGDDFDFLLEEDDEDNIIEEIADLLDIDESDVEDLIDIDEA